MPRNRGPEGRDKPRGPLAIPTKVRSLDVPRVASRRTESDASARIRTLCPGLSDPIRSRKSPLNLGVVEPRWPHEFQRNHR